MKHATGPSPSRTRAARIVRAVRRGLHSATATLALLVVGAFSGLTATTSNEAEAPLAGEATTLAAPTHCDERVKIRRATALHRGVILYSANSLEAACGRGSVPPCADHLGRRLPAGLSVPLRC